MSSISHNTLLFNIHDFVLLISATLYLLLAVMFSFVAHRDSNKTYLFLVVILFLFAAQSIDTLLIWSEPLRLLILSWHPSLIFWGGLGFWLQGPLLFWLVGSLIDSDFKFYRISVIHLIPTIIVATLLAMNYYLLAQNIQVEKMSNLRFFQSALMDNLITARYLSMIGYAGWCLAALSYKQKELVEKNKYTPRLYLWLRLGISSSIIIAAWPLLVHLTSNRVSLSTANIMGLGTNYLSFFFVNIFVFMTLKSSHFIQDNKKIEMENSLSEYPNGEKVIDPEPEKCVPLKMELIHHLENYMTREKPFLKLNINLEMLAAQLSMPERTLSRVINQHFKQNFVEFINRYRIEEAKKLLISDVNNQKSILTIMDESGFNSKSTFNSIFKQRVQMTPSQFRKTALKTSRTASIE